MFDILYMYILMAKALGVNTVVHPSRILQAFYVIY